MEKATSEGFTCTQRQKTTENDDEKDWEVIFAPFCLVCSRSFSLSSLSELQRRRLLLFSYKAKW
jgi:hypothetical protein